MERQISTSGMIDVLGNQFSTQSWIVFRSSESLQRWAMKNDQAMWATVQISECGSGP
jgi:hypothetical protein